MRRFPVLLVAGLVLLLAAAPRLRALTDDEKKQEFLETRAGADSSPTATPHHRHHHAESEPAPHHRHHHVASEEEETLARTHHHHTATSEPVTRSHEEEEATSMPRPVAPAPVPTVTPVPFVQSYRPPPPPPQPAPYRPISQPYLNGPPPQARATAAPTPPPLLPIPGVQVEVEKEGLEEHGGYEPPPPPPPRHHWWQIFSGSEDAQYRFLTPAIREAIDRAPVARNRWRYIVVHNSGTRQGNARIFDYYHRYVRKMPNGLAYHFVIGNGTSSGNGQIEIGGRWVKQLQGGHVHSDYLNNISLGICLVGDFNRDLPTREQLEALDELIRYLRIRVGKIDHRPAIVVTHREINPPRWPTDCPGARFPYHWLHSRFG